MKRELALLVILSAVAATACTQQRKLHMTEIGNGVVELYLDEPNDHSLALSDTVLRWQSVDHNTAGSDAHGEIALWGTLDGGKYMVVWEDPNHAGAPVYADYTNFDLESITGIVVGPDALGAVDPARSYAYRLKGHHFRYIFPFFYTYDDTDDEVRFGPNPRPSLGGAFQEDGHLGGNPNDPNAVVERTKAAGQVKGKSLRPSTLPLGSTSVPRDRDREIDWKNTNESYGHPEN